MTRALRYSLLWSITTLALGCGPSVEPQDVESWGQWETRVTLGPLEPAVIALVVDDRPTEEAAALRATVDEALRTTLSRPYGEYAGLDPAAWRPADWLVALALPSKSGSERLVGPDQVPALVYQSRSGSLDGALALADAVGAVMDANLAAAGAPYRPIEAASELALLLARVVSPKDDREAALVAATEREPGAFLGMVLATSGDDESPGAVTAYPMPTSYTGSYFLGLTLLIPALQTSPCPYFDLWSEPPSRLRSWIESLWVESYYPDVHGWPCGADEWVQSGVLRMFRSTTGRQWCTSLPIAMQGPRAECRILVESYRLDEGCDPERGWLDPLDGDGVRRPRTGRNELSDYRLCEVGQLDGAALESCRTTAACEGCPSGWCRAEGLGEMELGGSYDRCEPGWHPARLRFVGGAMAGAHGSFRVLCNLEL